ncbi:DMT family transporter [Glaciecola petra]|uniref:DMT family transporter n=1 Tax=Glaciecola petra TaxID=3075602 RepID=A0ABU2ZRQ2_9ALTE|nr:DMT family transporter [Aestuariibacter sp. P117]MDT0594926.1 DMT family transporter [Aestuariibacter sp. P117]
MFSLKPILIKYAYELGLNSEQVIALRMIIAMPFYLSLAIYFWVKKQDKRVTYKAWIWKISGLGVLGYFIASYLDLLGLQYISAQLERVVLFCFPTIVVVLSYFIFKTKLPKNIWLLLAMSYAGILIIFGHDLKTLGDEVLLGTFLVFISAVAFAIYVVFSKAIITQVGSQMFTSIAMLAASVVILVYFVATQPIQSLFVNIEQFAVVASVAIFCTVIPSLLVAEGIHRIGPERTSIVGTSGPAITSVLAVFLLDEAFTGYHGLGLALIMASIGLMIKPEKKSVEAKEQPDTLA